MDDNDILVKYRIMAAGTRRFSQRRFVDVNLTTISRDLNVDRSAVKQYYETAEVLLNAILGSFAQKIEAILLSFINGILIPTVRKGDLEIRKDRLHFATPQCARVFFDQVMSHLEAVFDYFLVHYQDLRLFVMESFAPGVNHGCVDKLLCLFLPVESNPLLAKTENMPELCLTHEAQAEFIQTSVLPMIGYALFKDSIETLSPHCNESHKEETLRSIRKLNERRVIGQDIFFTIK